MLRIMRVNFRRTDPKFSHTEALEFVEKDFIENINHEIHEKTRNIVQ